jgi:hypothetical protein
MDVERIVNKVLRDLIQGQFVREDDEGIVRNHLQRLATACWEEGSKSVFMHGEKEVIEYSKNRVEIARYPSVTIAAKKNNLHKDTLYKAIHEERTTRNGHIWKYKEAIPADSLQT